jgi:hypothetical protein
MPDVTCLLCDANATYTHTNQESVRYDCPKCGEYLASLHFSDYCHSESTFQNNRHKLSGFFFEINDIFKEDRPKRSAELNKNILAENFEKKILQNNPLIPRDLDMNSKILKLLNFMKRRTAYPGQIVENFSSHLKQIFYARDDAEVRFLLQEVKDNNLIDGFKVFGGGQGNYSLTINGPILTSRALSMLSGHEVNSKRIFLALEFSGEANKIIDDIFKKTVRENTGYDLQTVADVEHNNLIDDQIIAEINRSVAIVSDFTDGNRGAYYEAGYAHGQGKELIFLCKKSILEGSEKDRKPHFDVSHRNFIVWADSIDLQEKLIRRINATLGANNRGSIS